MSDSTEHSIPKIIHYVWVGGKPLTPLAEACVASWKKFLPEYELKLWNEDNSPMDHHYVQAMYAAKKWAFVSDYIRFWALSHEGGVYLDTDMEVLKPIDVFLETSPQGFVGKSSSGQIESSIIAAPKNAPFIAAALNFYDTDTTYTIVDTSPLVLERAIVAAGAEVTAYDYTHFHPCDEGVKCDANVLAQAYCRHHWAESWVPHAQVRKVARRLGVMSFLKYIKNKCK